MTRFFDSLTGATRAAVAALFLTLASVPAFGFLDIVEGAAEVSALNLKTTEQQTVYASVCDSCPTLTLSIGAQTQFFEGRTRVNLERVAQRSGGATVFFDPRTYKVTRVQFWR